MVRAAVVSVVSAIVLSAGMANAQMPQYCGYPFTSSNTFETVVNGRLESIDLSSLADIESLHEKDGLCTCLSADLNVDRNARDYLVISSINRNSIAQVSPTNKSCQRIKNETTIEEFRD